MRLGILHDAAAQERMHAREAAETAAKKKQAETPTVKTEAQIQAEEAAAEEEKKNPDKPKPVYKPKIRPLSESRAIELGANFISESFVFLVALGCIFAERIYSSRKEAGRRDELAERLDVLEAHAEKVSYLESEVKRLRTRYESETAPDDAMDTQENSTPTQSTSQVEDSKPQSATQEPPVDKKNPPIEEKKS